MTMEATTAMMPEDYAGDDRHTLANQLQEIANEYPGSEDIDEIDVRFYRGELRRVVELLRAASGE